MATSNIDWSDWSAWNESDNDNLGRQPLVVESGNNTSDQQELTTSSSSEEIDDYSDTRDFDVNDADYLRDQLQFFFTEIEELPVPVWNFQPTEKLTLIEHFDENNITTGPAGELLIPDGASNEKDYFLLFFTDELVQQICEFTNAHAAASDNTVYGAWKELSVRELHSYYAIRAFIENFCKDNIESLWKDHGSDHYLLEMPAVRTVFTHKRYKQITKYLHYYAPGTEPQPTDPTRDRAFKIRHLVNYMKIRFKKMYVCGEHIVVDECVVPFRGRLGLKQYFKDKPVKWGVKLWMLCDSKSGYCWNFDIYSGKDEDFNDLENIGVVSAVVIKLCQELSASNRTIFTDRYYTSPSLAYYLEQLGFRFCGTAMTNRRGFPKDLIKKATQCNQGEFQWLMCQSTHITATRWCDKKPIYFISTGYRPEIEECSVVRHDKRGNALTVPCTPAVKRYNEMMGGVDMSDKMAKLDKSRKSYRWYTKVDRKMVMLSLANARILFNEVHNKKATLRDFVLQTIHQLIGNQTYRARKRGRPSISTKPESRLVDVSHFPVKGEGKDHVCIVCNRKHSEYKTSNKGVTYQDNPFKRCKTTIMCRTCNVYLCSPKSCFVEYHSKVEYWK